MTTSKKYEEKAKQLERKAVNELQIALRPYWEEAYRNAQDGDLVGKLRHALDEMDVNLRELAVDLLPPITSQERQMITRFLEDEEPLDDFCQIGNSLAANKSSDAVLDKFNEWMLDWGIQYLREKENAPWTEADEKKMWRMVHWALPRQNANQDKWQAFAAEIGSRSLRKATQKHMDGASHLTPRVLASILDELPSDADELLQVDNEAIPSLKAIAEIKDPLDLADNYLVNYSPSAWRQAIDSTSAENTAKRPPVLTWVGVVAVAIVAICLVLFGLNRLGVFGIEATETSVAEATDVSGVVDETSVPDAPVTGEADVSETREVLEEAIPLTLTMSDVSACAAGKESWHMVTVAGMKSTTYLNSSLPSGVTVWQVDSPPSLDDSCQVPKNLLNTNLLDANGNAYLIVSQPTGGEGFSLNVTSNNQVATLLLEPWDEVVSAQLSAVNEIPPEGFLLTEAITLTWALTPTVRGDYVVVCETMPADDSPLHRVVSNSVSVSDESNQAECVIEPGVESEGEWQASVFPASDEGKYDETYFNENKFIELDEVHNFSIHNPRYELAIQPLSEYPVGIRWANSVEIAPTAPLTQTITEYKLGYIPTYVITNTGNITNEIQINLSNEGQVNLDLDSDWVYFVTVLETPDILTGTLSSPIPNDIQNGYVITLTHTDETSHPLTAIVPSETDTIRFSSLPSETLYIAIWLDTNTLTNVTEANPVKASINFLSSPEFSVVETKLIEINSFAGGEINIP